MTPDSAVTTFPLTRLSTLFNYLLVIVVNTTLIAGLVSVIYAVAPDPVLLLVPVVGLLIIVEGLLTTHWLAHPDRRHVNRLLYRAAELVFIAVTLRLLTWLLGGQQLDPATLRDYILSPLLFFDPQFMGFLFIGLIAWDRALTFGGIIRAVSLSDEEISFYSLPAYQRSLRAEDRPYDANRQQRFVSLVSNWIIGGIVLAICAAVTTIDFPAPDAGGVISLRNVGRLGLRPEVLVTLLTYFIAGFWLISRIRLVAMRTRWIINGIQVQPGVEKSWNRASLLLILLVATVAAFLPIGSSFGISRILAAIAGILLLAVNLFLVLISLIIYAFLALFGRQGATPPPLSPLDELAPTPQPQPPPVVNETAALVFGALFWIIVVAVTLLALWFFLRGRGFRPERSQLFSLLRRFLVWLRSLWRGATAGVAALGERLALPRPAPETQPGRSPWRFFRLNALSARDQIRYFYLSTVRRAEERGLARARSETPSEYAAGLKESWPDLEGEIDALTEAFQHARYSREEFEQEDVSPVKQIWQRVRNSLRRRRPAAARKTGQNPES